MQKRGQSSAIETILFILVFLPVILLLLSPVIILVIISIIFYKKWKKERTDSRLALMLASAISTLLLIGLSIMPIFYTFKGIGDPFFFVSLLYIFGAIPKILLTFILVWVIGILSLSIRSKIKHGAFLTESIKKWHIVLSLIFIIIIVSGFSIYQYKNYTLKKAESLTSDQEIRELLNNYFVKVEGKLSNELAFWSDYDYEEPPTTIIAIAMNNNTGDEILVALSMNSELEVRRAVARNPNTPEEIIHKLYEKDGRKMTRAILDNPEAPQDILRKVYEEGYKNNDPSWLIYDLAQNPNTPEDILYELANKPRAEQAHFIIGLARNPSLPNDLIEKLRNDSEQVRQAVEEVHGNNNINSTVSF